MSRSYNTRIENELTDMPTALLSVSDKTGVVDFAQA